MKAETLARYFDHTILNPAAKTEEVEQVCQEALEHGFFSVCVNPVHVRWVSRYLARSTVQTCSVIGFPLGAATTEIKSAETAKAIGDGAHEIDMVINIGALKDGDDVAVTADIRAVVEAAKGNVVKVIIETCLLDDAEKVRACELSKQAGAHFVKTSTGFAGGGATVEDVALMKKTVGKGMNVKASGGIKTPEDALAMIEAGADRIGASAGVAIMKALT
ncbi:MAG: deoxyribose-phosphate aldolase [Desulfobacteraceae bacterium]|nr:MAG: deoxyribose-phosphate aldolase [Desulfobacteraceae bacterium]